MKKISLIILISFLIFSLLGCSAKYEIKSKIKIIEIIQESVKNTTEVTNITMEVKQNYTSGYINTLLSNFENDNINRFSYETDVDETYRGKYKYNIYFDNTTNEKVNYFSKVGEVESIGLMEKEEFEQNYKSLFNILLKQSLYFIVFESSDLSIYYFENIVENNSYRKGNIVFIDIITTPDGTKKFSFKMLIADGIVKYIKTLDLDNDKYNYEYRISKCIYLNYPNKKSN